ncbi:MAG: DUF3606 domain-containing protein [Alphaproteobacteria bacterium]|nr:DUF3606 domain-containing protein [Alphaproteobacteria bacterium]
MADDKRKKGPRDRRAVARGEGYEVSYLARKHGLTSTEAGGLIDRVGNDRAKLNAAADKLRRKKP